MRFCFPVRPPEQARIASKTKRCYNYAQRTIAVCGHPDNPERERLLLQQGLTESLAGRFETTYMGHWSLSEMEKAFGWNSDQYVWFGGYPDSAPLISDEQRWKAYVQQALNETSISKDALMLTRIDKPALISAQSGELFKDIQIKPEAWGRLVESSIGAHLINYSLVGGFTVPILSNLLW